MPNTTPSSYLPNAAILTANSSGVISGATASKKHLVISLDAEAPNDIPQYSAGDDADIRRLLFAILDVVSRNYDAQESKPTKMVIAKNGYLDEAENNLVRQFIFTFTTNFTGEEIVSEPT